MDRLPPAPLRPERLLEITARYPELTIAIAGDFCLDRYFDIDPDLAETSLETGLPVHNITRVRCQPGAAGTILNNLVALGIGEIVPVGFTGDDAEGWELRRALRRLPGVVLDHLLESASVHTFTYTKPLVHERGAPPRELSRLDQKNWSPTPTALEAALVRALRATAEKVHAVIVLDQVDVAGTGVVTGGLLEALGAVSRSRPALPILADSRRGLGDFPPAIFKMNARELGALTGLSPEAPLEGIEEAARGLAARNGRAVVVTLAERGMIHASPSGAVERRPALPIRGPIDIVGAGDAVTANLAAALAAGAAPGEAIELASLAASIVIHQLGTTGTASVQGLLELLRTRQQAR